MRMVEVLKNSPTRITLFLATFSLFFVWGNSFIAIGFLLGNDGNPARFDWVGLMVARFLVAAFVAGSYLVCFLLQESIALFRRHKGRLAICATLNVPAYNLALNYAQQNGVPAHIASLTTTLAPLFIMFLAAIFLGEQLTKRRLIGFTIAAAGMTLIANSKGSFSGYSLMVGITVLAPLCWSIYSVLSKPALEKESAIVWTYLGLVISGLYILPLAPFFAWGDLVALDTKGWFALLYLSIPCTVVGFAIWSWLLRHLPASSVGFTVFLNPPLTSISKFVLALIFPATFMFSISGWEWIGAVITLIGLSVAIHQKRVKK